jgi:hypothetical protein
MAKKKLPRDVNQLARQIVDEATDNSPKDETPKSPAAVELGRKGGLKGGRVRAAKISKAQLSESARRAANARWANKKKSS